MRKTSLIILIIAITLIAVACSKKDEGAKEKGSTTNNEATPETNIYPYTGIKTDDEVTDRAIAVMVNNHPQARPQSGLSKADIVFEMLTEGDITRFLAIYQSTAPEVVGPVRSAREYFFTLADEGYDAIYVYHGAANFVNDMIKTRGIENLPGAVYDNDGHLFVRESFRKAPHNSYFQFGAAYDVAEEKGYDTKLNYEALLFTDDESDVEGEEANSVQINYSSTSTVRFDYDESDQKYTRYNDGEQTVELDTNEPIKVDNVFVVETEHRVIDEERRRFIDIESGGSAYLFQRGKVQKIDWENRDGRIIPVKDGQVVPFVPGQTWINFVPTTPAKGVSEQIQILMNDVTVE